MKSNLLYIAMFLLILCIPVAWKENEINWLWEDLLWVPLTLTFISLNCIALYIYKKNEAERLRQANKN